MNLHREPVPPPLVPILPILSPRPGHRPIEAVVLSEAVFGCYTHYEGERTRPCFWMEVGPGPGSRVECPYCKQGLPRRWKGYVAVQTARSGRLALVELTRAAMELCPRLHPGRSSLRGVALVVTRIGTSRQGRVVAQARDQFPPGHPDLPPAPDVEAALIRLWMGGENGFRP